ncbi:MAG: hypothetical protein Q8N88_05940 [Nanoarchaeota archaeon]|nr:hypothetical protein [Nanoarchaeota archaeon]
MTGSFNIEKAQAAAARAAFLSTKLSIKDFTKIELYTPDINLTNFNINNPDLVFLQRFKKTNPEAFFYWYHSLKTNGQLE